MQTTAKPEGPKLFLKYWLVKLDAISAFNFPQRQQIYKEAMLHVPGSYKLWRAYLDEFTLHVSRRSVLHKSVAELGQAFDQCLQYMSKMPRIYLMYAKFLESTGQIAKLYNLLNIVLTKLPVTQHNKIWDFYAPFAERCPIPKLGAVLLKRYSQIEPAAIEDYAIYLQKKDMFSEAARALLAITNNVDFRSEKGTSPYQFHLSLAKILASKPNNFTAEEADKFFRNCLVKFPSDVSEIWVLFAEFQVRKGRFKAARDLFDEALSKMQNERDFGVVYDACLRFEEEVLGFFTDETAFNWKDVQSRRVALELCGTVSSIEAVQEAQINRLEHLLNSREILLNSVKLRLDNNNISFWIERFRLLEQDETAIDKAFSDCINTVKPIKAVGLYSKVWNYIAEYHERKGALNEMNQVFLQALETEFKLKSEYSRLFRLWVEALVRNGFEKDGLMVCKWFLYGSGGRQISDSGRLVRAKSIIGVSAEAWSLYLDLEAAFGTEEELVKAYQSLLSRRVATPVNTFNYLRLLLRKGLLEQAGRVCEEALSIFSWPGRHLFWLFYIDLHFKRFGGDRKEQARDLLSRAVADCPKDKLLIYGLMTAEFEEEHGFYSLGAKALEETAKKANIEDAPFLSRVQAAFAYKHFGISEIRHVYKKALETLNGEALVPLGLELINVEKRYGEVDRARTLFKYMSQFVEPEYDTSGMWRSWEEFEIGFGNEDTYKELVRLKKAVSQRFANLPPSLRRVQRAIEQETLQSGQVGDNLEESEGENEAERNDNQKHWQSTLKS